MCSSCNDGLTFMSSACTLVSDAECTPCSACPDGFYGANCGPETDSTCQAVSSCQADQYEAQAPGQFNDRVCFDISPPCTPFLEVETAAATPTSDRVCINNTCASGYYATTPATPTSNPYVYLQTAIMCRLSVLSTRVDSLNARS